MTLTKSALSHALMYIISEPSDVTTAFANLLSYNIVPPMHWQDFEKSILVNSLKAGERFTCEDKKAISEDLHRAVDYLHRNNIYHGAIKENCILIYKVGQEMLEYIHENIEHFDL